MVRRPESPSAAAERLVERVWLLKYVEVTPSRHEGDGVVVADVLKH